MCYNSNINYKLCPKVVGSFIPTTAIVFFSVFVWVHLHNEG